MPSQALLCVFGWQISGGLDINSEQPSEKKNRIRHSPFVDARLPYSLDFSFFLYSSIYSLSIPTGCIMSSGKRNVFDLLYI
jgi:hypothetical protein